MVRHRIPSSSSAGADSRHSDAKGLLKKPKKTSAASINYVQVGKICAFFLMAFYLVWIGYQGYLESRVHTPLHLPRATDKSGLEVSQYYWGSYRPGVYFGLKTRAPSNLLFGLMWINPEQMVRLRHWCDQGDDLATYGWLQHDGETFGRQEIKDGSILLKTSFIKGDPARWSARVSVEPSRPSKKPKHVTLFFYFGMDEKAQDYTMRPIMSGKDMIGIVGKTETLSGFRVDFVPHQSQANEAFYSLIDSQGPQAYSDNVLQRLKVFQVGGQRVIGLDSEHMRSQDPNLIVYQVNAQLPFEMDVSFSASLEDEAMLVGEDFSKALAQKSQDFDARFESTFNLVKLGYNQTQIQFAQAAMSNMVGGIGYFYGHSLVQSEYHDVPVRYWDGPLFTAVPSRSFFPRGFLWDEGFHNLLISKWNKRLSADIIAHWLDMMNVEGWIPREQILGLEARAKVPREFVVQKNTNANPPTLLLTLHSMVTDFKKEDKVPQWFEKYLTRIWPRLEVWYNWFNQTQKGQEEGTFRWRGRNATAIHELNPKTLTSGLDDYPRASHPTDFERHVDLRCWMALASRLMADIGAIIGRDAEKFSRSADFLHNNQILDQWHWSDDHGAYLDYGLHSEDVVLQRPRPPPGQKQMDKQRVVHEDPREQYVNQVGYVSLFPFLLGIVDPASPRLGKILKDINNPAKLWTPYGLRSLSKTASIYMKRNTEHDAPYWRGPIWININYLAVRALHAYSLKEGPFKSELLVTYKKLRQNLIDNIYSQYVKTGYIWEQYNDKTGHGQGCRPFTGWSSLVVLMMGENY